MVHGERKQHAPGKGIKESGSIVLGHAPGSDELVQNWSAKLAVES